MLLRFSEAWHQIYVSCLVRICLCWVLCISYEWFFKWDECKSSEKPCLSVFVCRPTEPSKGKLCQGVLTNFITSHLLPYLYLHWNRFVKRQATVTERIRAPNFSRTVFTGCRFEPSCSLFQACIIYYSEWEIMSVCVSTDWTKQGQAIMPRGIHKLHHKPLTTSIFMETDS